MGVGVIIRVSLLLVLAASTACTKKNPEKCESNADCEEPLSFCDIKGEFEESGYEPKTCTVRPADCPLERCGCEPGEALTCDVDQLTVCNEDGTSTSTTTCGLGCSNAEPRCLGFEPSNGLSSALVMAAGKPAVVLPANARIDTELGLVQDGNGTPIDVPSVVVPQNGFASIRAFIGSSFVLNEVRIEGRFAVAFVATGDISVRGKIDASASAAQSGPGAQESPAACAGATTYISSCTLPPLVVPCGQGAGGGGNALVGAEGGGLNVAGKNGGGAIANTTPLLGGCQGGSVNNSIVGQTTAGGGGGGAVQFVSNKSVQFTSAGFVDVTGGGGPDSGGGGAGGTIVIEAPSVTFNGSATGISANGGAGGGCGMYGEDGLASASAAQGPICTNYSAGDGGTASLPPEPGFIYVCPSADGCIGGTFGGGGGSVGQVTVRSRSGDYDTIGTPLLSAKLRKHALDAR